jgi:hypothetical protein
MIHNIKKQKKMNTDAVEKVNPALVLLPLVRHLSPALAFWRRV